MGTRMQGNDIKRKHIIQTNLYNRYLLLRYSLALFFFMNLNWMIANVLVSNIYAILPGILLCVSLPAMYEQIKVYREHTNNLVHTKRFFLIQLFAQIVFILLTCTFGFKSLYPFLSDKMSTRLVTIILLLFGASIAFMTLNRIEHIKQNTDRFYIKFQKYINYIQ